LLVFRQLFFDTLLTYYIVIGNILVFGVLVVASTKKRYVRMIEEYKNIIGAEKERLDKLSSLYIIISLIPLIAFFTFQLVRL
jgi:hypothetical protein